MDLHFKFRYLLPPTQRHLRLLRRRDPRRARPAGPQDEVQVSVQSGAGGPGSGEEQGQGLFRDLDAAGGANIERGADRGDPKGEEHWPVKEAPGGLQVLP